MTVKSTPSPASSNASVETVMALHKSVRIAITAQCLHPCQVHLDSLERAEAALRAEVSRLATGRPSLSYRERASAIPDDILRAGVQAAMRADTRVTAGGVQAAFIKMSELLAALPAAPGAAQGEVN